MSIEGSSGAYFRNVMLVLFAVGILRGAYRCGTERFGSTGTWQRMAEDMPKRDKEFPKRFVPHNAVPRPLENCEDEVGGVESITIGGSRYWFGFSYSADAVLSPLIDDRRVMAQFGSDHMLQTDGAHPPEYWESLVEVAENSSDLTGDVAARIFTGFEIRDVSIEIEAARREGRLAKD